MASARDPSAPRRCKVGIVCLAAAVAAGRAYAADATYAFDIPRKPLGAALIDVAVEANISISTQNVGFCTDQGRPLIGRFTATDGLRRLLAGTGCGFRQWGARAFEITRLAPVATPRPAAKAPAPPSAPPAEPFDIVVVATKRPTPADRLAYSVSVADERLIGAQGINDLADLTSVMPAMTATNLGPGRDKILLRGLSDGPLTGRTQSMVGLYLDDTRLTFNAPDPDLRLVDIEKVEVLRGPQGALYGAGSLGGVVQTVTMQPDTTRVDGWVATAVGFTTSGGPSQSIDAVLNAPFASGRGAARVVIYHELQGGYIKDAALGVNNANSSLRDGGRIAFKFELNDRWVATAGAVVQSLTSKDTQYEIAGEPRYTRDNQLREPHDNDFNAYHVGVKGDLGWAEVKSSTAYIQHLLFSRYDASTNPPVPVPPGPVAFDDRDAIDSVVTETSIASTNSGRFQWFGGLFLAHSDQTTHSVLTALRVQAVHPYEEFRGDRLDEAAMFGEMVMPISSTTSVTLGGRLFTSRTAVSSQVATSLSPATLGYRGAAAESGFAPKAVVDFKPTPGLLLYAQASEGYRAKGINTTGPSVLAFASPEDLEPLRQFRGDELWSVEAGAKLSLLAGRMRLRTAAFEATWKSIQSDQLLVSGLPFTANIGNGHNAGLEFEGSYRTGALELRGQLLWNQPELVRVNPDIAGLTDLGLSTVPDLSFGASAQYAWALQSGLSAELNGRWAYIGSSELALATATTQRMGGYSTSRLASTLAADRWRMTLAIDNLGNVRGDTFAFGNPFSLGTSRQMTPLRPRTISIALKVSY